MNFYGAQYDPYVLREVVALLGMGGAALALFALAGARGRL